MLHKCFISFKKEDIYYKNEIMKKLNDDQVQGKSLDKWIDSEDIDYVMQVIDATAENISSMLQDIRALRHTEIDYINGFLLRRARAHGIAVPENTRLFEMVKRKESEYERIGTGLPRPW